MGIAGSNRHPDRAARKGGRSKPATPAAPPATTKRAKGSASARAAATSRAAASSGIAATAVASATSTRHTSAAPGNGASAKFEFTIPSVLSAIRDVHKTVMDEVERLKYGEQAQFAIRLALEEGLMNAVKHGNKLDASKTVHVRASVTSRATEITIEDQGAGFQRDTVPDPCAVENLLKCSGRGILLMEAYMDKVEYTQGGRRVRMVKKNA